MVNNIKLSIEQTLLNGFGANIKYQVTSIVSCFITLTINGIQCGKLVKHLLIPNNGKPPGSTFVVSLIP